MAAATLHPDSIFRSSCDLPYLPTNATPTTKLAAFINKLTAHTHQALSDCLHRIPISTASASTAKASDKATTIVGVKP